MSQYHEYQDINYGTDDVLRSAFDMVEETHLGIATVIISI